MPTKAELEAAQAAAAVKVEQAGLLRKLHADTRVPDPKKVAKKPTWNRDKKTGEMKEGKALDYLGHADVTDLLLTHDPHWNWEPLAWTDAGLPGVVKDKEGWPVGLWIKLTVHGVTRLGYGNCPPGKDDAIKELIGDAIRNASMRFGVALQLWSKAEGDGWAELPPPAAPDPAPVAAGPTNGNGQAAVNAPLTPEAPPAPAPTPAPETPPEAAAAPVDRKELEVAVGTLLGAMRGDGPKRFADEKRRQGWPGDMTTLPDDKLREVHAFLLTLPVARVAN